MICGTSNFPVLYFLLLGERSLETENKRVARAKGGWWQTSPHEKKKMLRSALAVAAAGGSSGTIVSFVLLSSMRVYAVAMVWSISLMIVAACYVFRIIQIYFCATTSTLPHDENEDPPRHDERVSHGEGEEEDVHETVPLHQDDRSPKGGKQLDARFFVSILSAASATVVCILFLTMLDSSDDVARNESSIGSAKGFFASAGMGTLFYIALFALLLEVWAAGWLSCGCCPRVISVPTYLLPKHITVAVLSASGGAGCVIGVICRALVVGNGLDWCGDHVAVGATVGLGVGGVVGVALWAYTSFVFLPDFKRTCSPLQRDSYFGVVEAIKHKENLDGIGDDAL